LICHRRLTVPCARPRHALQDGVYADVADRHPDAAVIVPPRSTAALRLRPRRQRDRHIQCIAEWSRMAWQKASDYNRRAKVEAAIGRWKQVIGNGRPSTRGRVRARIEVTVAVYVLNRMLQLRRPGYVRIV
jgi:hypothetical protein